MPFYEYACRTCGTGFEQLRRMDDRLTAPRCPSCQSEQTVLRPSVPGMVGATAPAASVGPACGMDGDAGGCCGGGACMN